MTRLRGLVIGAGYFSQFHFDAWNRMDDVELVGVCDVNRARAAEAARQWRILQSHGDAAQAIQELKPDFVDIVTRPDTHLDLVRLAASHKIAIICQKPLAPDFEHSQELVRVAQQASVPLMVHENFRFQPWYREIKRLLESGRIGSRLHSLYFRARPGDGWGPDAYLSRQPYFREMPRLLVHETGVHFIDTFRFLAGEIAEVYAILRRLNPAIQGEDTGLLTFRFANGAVGVWDANRYNETTAADPRYTFGQLLVETDGGSVRLDEEGRIFLKPLGEPEVECPYAHERRAFASDCVFATQRHFIDCLRSGQPFETGGEAYLRTLAVQEAVYNSHERKQPMAVALHGVDQASQQAVQKELGGAGECDLKGQPAIAARRTNRRIVDLSLSINNELRGVSITTAKTIAADGWNATTLNLYSHCGTHMDAPKHFVEGAESIDRQTLDTCCGPARVLDLTPVQPRELITVERIARWDSLIQPGDRLLMRTDWYKRFGTPSYRDELPRISLELARWLVERRVALVGVEPPSVADVNAMRELTDVHQALFYGGVLIVEGLAHLDELSGDIVEFIALPLKISDGDGSPVRAIAIEERI